MSRRDDDPRPRRIVRRPIEVQWAKVENYPLLEYERIRGVDVFVTKEPSPLLYRIVISAKVRDIYRVPAVVAIPNERKIRFGTAPVEFFLLEPGEKKARPVEFPTYGNVDVIISNPDFVEFEP